MPLTPEQIKQIEREADKYAEECFIWPKNAYGEEIVQRIGQNPYGWRKHKNNVMPHYIAGRKEGLEREMKLVKILDMASNILAACGYQKFAHEIAKEIEQYKNS